MHKLKKFTYLLCMCLTFMSFTCLKASHDLSNIQPNKQIESSKVYIAADQLVFQDNHLFVIDEGQLHFIKSIEQDELGVYYYKQALYGFCPYGHAYGPDGGCFGYNCPFN
ncbi:hypothetical protein [Parachlamydia acanthamoebae]|uniref:hypothetical protein n=1 Tax=Parachlamydia acanthamoebae TaxID=83552 RepID=UPI00163F37C7|nr:hypothetical protein [Parachlamydia acanthamoebae]